MLLCRGIMRSMRSMKSTTSIGAGRLQLCSLRSPSLMGMTFSRTATGVSANDEAPSPDTIDRVRALSAEVTRNVDTGIATLRARFGERHAEKIYMSEYYRHRDAGLLVPAAAALCRDPLLSAMPSLSAKSAIFLGYVLRGLPAETQAQYGATLTMVTGVDIGWVLAALHVCDTPPTKAIFDRLAVSLRRAGNSALITAGQHVGHVPRLPVDEWPTPFTHATWTAPAWEPNAAPASPFAFEVTPVFAAARSSLSQPEWLLVASTAVLESQWAAFYATGDKRYVRRVVNDFAPAWAEFAHLPDSVQYALSLETPLPEHLQPSTTGTDRSHADMLRAVRANVSRVAVWSLLHHTRRHPGTQAQQPGDAAIARPDCVLRSLPISPLTAFHHIRRSPPQLSRRCWLSRWVACQRYSLSLLCDPQRSGARLALHERQRQNSRSCQL